MYERASISPFSRRRLTRDWRILQEDVEDYRFSKCTTRRKTYVNEVWLESNVDLQNLVFNTLDFVTGSYYEGSIASSVFNLNLFIYQSPLMFGCICKLHLIPTRVVFYLLIV